MASNLKTELATCFIQNYQRCHRYLMSALHTHVVCYKALLIDNDIYLDRVGDDRLFTG